MADISKISKEELNISMKIDSFLLKKTDKSKNNSYLNKIDDIKEHKESDNSYILDETRKHDEKLKNIRVQKSILQKKSKYKENKYKLKHNKNYFEKLNEDNLKDLYIKYVEEFKNINKLNIELVNELSYLKKIIKQIPEKNDKKKNVKINIELEDFDKIEELKKTIGNLKKSETLIKNKILKEKQLLKNKIRKNEEYLNRLKNKKRLVKTVTDKNQPKNELKKEEYINLIDEVKKRIRIVEDHIKKLHAYLKNKGWKYNYNVKLMEDVYEGKNVKNKTNLNAEMINLQSNLKVLENEHKLLKKSNFNYNKHMEELILIHSKIKEENIINEKKIREYENSNPHKLKGELEILLQKESSYKARLDDLMSNNYLKENSEVSKVLVLLNEYKDKKIKNEILFNELNSKNEIAINNISETKEGLKVIKEEIIRLDEQRISLENMNEDNYNKDNSFINNTDNQDLYLKILKLINKNQYLKNIQNELNLKNKVNDVEEFYETMCEDKKQLINKLEISKSILKENMNEEKDKQEKFNLKKLQILKKIDRIKNETQGIESILGNYENKENKPFVVGFNKITGEDYYYDNNISIFSENTTDYENLKNLDDNLLDIHLGKFEIDNLNYERNNFLLGVSFKNFETSTSSLVSGVSGNFNFLSSFIINTSSLSLLNLYEEDILIELYMKNINGDIKKLAMNKIKLKNLIDDNMNRIYHKSSSVKKNIIGLKSIETKSIVGNINYSIRFRIPIVNNTNLIQKDQLTKDNEIFSENRNIFIKIENGYDFPIAGKSFFNFEFFNYKEFSSPVLGATPEFNYQKRFSIKTDKNFREIINNQKLEIAFFDDSIPLDKIFNDEDYIGSCYLNLKNLLYDKPIYGKFIIYKNKEEICSALISIYFEDAPLNININEFKYDRIWENKCKKIIVSNIKDKKLTLNNIFFNKNKNISDLISKDEFILSIKNLVSNYFKDEEIDVIFEQIRKKNPFVKKKKFKNEISLVDIENYFGNLLSVNMIFDDSIKNINRMLDNNNKSLNKNLIDKDNFIINRFKIIFENYMEENKLKVIDLYIELDENNNGLLSRTELDDFFKKKKIKISKNDILKIYDLADTNKDGDVDIKEFFTLIHLNSQELINIGKSFIKDKTILSINDNLLTNFIDLFQNYMDENNLDLIKIYNILDSKKTGELTRKDFKNKIINKFKFDYNDIKLDYLFNQIDADSSGTVQIAEFFEFFKKKEILKKMEDFDYQITLEKNNVIKNIYDYLCKNNYSVADFILKIDDDESGTISVLELNAFLRKYNLYNDNKDLEEFFSLIIHDGSLEFTCDHLSKIIFAYDKITKIEVPIEEKTKYKLLNGIQNLLNSKQKELNQNFKVCESHQKGIILVNEFIEILESVSKFNTKEIDLILNPIMLPYRIMNKINFNDFLNITSKYKEFIDNYKSKFKNNNIMNIFRILKQKVKNADMDNYGFYLWFTDNNKRKFNIEALKSVLDNIQLEYDLFDAEEFFSKIDTESDGAITYAEFNNLIMEI